MFPHEVPSLWGILVLRGDKDHRVEDSEEGTNGTGGGLDGILTITERVHDSLGGYNIRQIPESTSVQTEIVYTAHAFQSSLESIFDYPLFGIYIACDSSLYVNTVELQHVCFLLRQLQ